MINRRQFLQAGGATLALAGFPYLPVTANQRPKGRLAVIILEGGMDGLGAVQPIGDSALFDLRPELISKNPLLINDSFAINPKLSKFATMVMDQQGMVVHATSIPYKRRSHFEGQNLMESGLKTPFSSDTGWLGRALSLLQVKGRALSLDKPLLLRGYDDIENIYPSNIKGVDFLQSPLIASVIDVAGPDFAKSLELLKSAVQAGEYAGGPRDPAGLAYSAGQAMALEDGPLAAVVRVGEFDTHARQQADQGQFGAQISIVDQVFDSFKRGLGDKWSDTVVLTLTEFGRTVRQNGSSGTDHGYGTSGLVAGGPIAEGKVIADWPTLKTTNQFEGRDLMATIDYRSVCAACLNKVFNIDHDEISREVFKDPSLQNISKYMFG